MTKHVFTTSQCAHVWAQQHQYTGRNAKNSVHFIGRTFYSYSTPIAAFVPVKGRGNVVLVTSERFSVTANGKHVAAVWRALRAEQKTFTVPRVDMEGGIRRGDHAKNLAYLLDCYHAARKRALRARDDYEWLYDTMRTGGVAVIEYAETFKLRGPATLDYDGDIISVQRARAEREERLNTPANVAKREKARVAREALRERKEAADNARRTELSKGAIAEWRAGSAQDLFHRDMPTMLRVKGDVVQTSHGAEFPVAHAIKAFTFIAARRAAGEAWEKNGHSIHLGNFTIDRITGTGDVVAGCHRVAWAEIEACARLLKLVEG